MILKLANDNFLWSNTMLSTYMGYYFLLYTATLEDMSYLITLYV